MIWIIEEHYDNGEEYDEHEHFDWNFATALTENTASKYLQKYKPAPEEYTNEGDMDEKREWIEGMPPTKAYRIPKEARRVFYRKSCHGEYEMIWYTIISMKTIEEEME